MIFGASSTFKTILMAVFSVAEISFIFWLLIKGVSTPKPEELK